MNKNPVYEVWCWNERTGSFTNATDDPANGSNATSVRKFRTAYGLASRSAGFSWYGDKFNGDHFMVVTRLPDGTRVCDFSITSPAVLLKSAVAAANAASAERRAG